MTAGHNALRADQVPVKNPHSMMQWHKWVVLTAGSTRSALRRHSQANLEANANHQPARSGSRPPKKKSMQGGIKTRPSAQYAANDLASPGN
jgi:hypothetical protein